jgi:hypothetical protein
VIDERARVVIDQLSSLCSMWLCDGMSRRGGFK